MARRDPLILRWIACAIACATVDSAVAAADTWLDQARTAFRAGHTDEAISLAGRAIQMAPDDPRGYELRGDIHAAARKSAEAVADYSRALKLDPRRAELFDRRGSEQFKLGRIAESIADFDRYIQLRPDQERQHWKRGISYYYAGRYGEGRKQFDGYQTFDSNDVENAVWRYLCMAKSAGVERARADILKVKDDRRVPMRQVYELFAGRTTPEDVLRAATSGEPPPAQLNERVFYAHLYVGLYYEAVGDTRRALEHIAEAERHRIAHYMWDVARVHATRLREADRDEKP
ncbi:MAG: tetratricopeptide repeat protein [Planctomycetia bacterium]|nr:tetratricopeptide repeat protein [Planctomycetia bacterium]